MWIRQKKALSRVFIVAMVISGTVLMSTAWHGGELVYRYGLGVMSLPKAEGDGHDHSHGGGHDHGGSRADNHHDDMNDMDFSGMDEMMDEDEHGHNNSHDHEH